MVVGAFSLTFGRPGMLKTLCSFTFSILFAFGVTPECFQTQNSPQQTFADDAGGNQTNSHGQFQKSIARPMMKNGKHVEIDMG